MNRKSAVRVATATAVLVITTLISSAATAGGQVTSPNTTPDGKGFTTEQQAVLQHDAEWNRKTTQLRASLRDVRPAAPKTASPYATLVTPYTLVTSPYFETGSGYILDQATSGVTNNIWSITLKILSKAWKTVGGVLSEITFFFNLTVDRSKPSYNQSYHSYHYWARDGKYYWPGGSWQTAVRVETRNTMSNGWSSWYDINGRQWQQWLYQNPQVLETNPSCHYYNATWIRGMAEDVAKGMWGFIAEPWSACVWFNP